jgi:TRAP-type C4-dicarboxylate transport system substrate-binding protein
VARYLVSLAVLAAIARPADAQVVLKLGTLAPQGSSWHEILKEMGQRWAEASGGEVKLRIYPGGVQGNEGDMIRKLGVGQLQAAALSNVGMHDITPGPKALSIPLFFADEAEAECVFERVRPALEAALEQRGFAVVHWSRLGALHLFCTEPRRTPADMATSRFFAQEGDSRAADAWRAAGFRPVQLSANDLYPALQTGMVDCVPSLPIYVLTARLFEKARHMADLAWGHMYGATIVRRDAWERIPVELRHRLLAIARGTGLRADAEVRRMNGDALAAMRRQGLSIVSVDPLPWRAAMGEAHRMLRGDVVPAAFFDALGAARAACRSAAGGDPTAPARR